MSQLKENLKNMIWKDEHIMSLWHRESYVRKISTSYVIIYFVDLGNQLAIDVFY